MNDLKNFRLCECCRRIMPNFSKGLFCNECIRAFNEDQKNGTPFKIGGPNAKK